MEEIGLMFEKRQQIDNSLHRDPPREKDQRIEMSDHELLERNERLRREQSKTIINHPPKIPMNLEMPQLEQAIKKGNKNAKSKSKRTQKKPEKNNSRTNKSAMADIQKKL